MKRKIGFLAMLAVIMFIAGLGAGSLKYKNIIGNNKNSSGNISITESGSGIIEEQVDNDSGNASAVKDIKETDSASEKSKKRKYLQGVQEPSGSVLPGHNTYFNGFDRQTNLTYDDVALVFDSQYTFAIGTYYVPDYFNEQIQSTDSGNNILVWNGCIASWKEINYRDIEIGYINFNPIINDYSGEHNYIDSITLNTARFQTAKGIHVGSTINEMLDTYNTKYYINVDTTFYTDDDGSDYYYLITDGVTLQFYFDEETQIITKIKLFY